jgi:hypothetical protein
MRRRLLAVLLSAVLFPTGGCVPLLALGGATAAVGTVVWTTGWLREDFAEPIARVHRAAAATLHDFRWQAELNECDGKAGIVDTFTPEGTRIVIETKMLDPKHTRVSIRVGIGGNRSESERILAQLKKNL